MAGNLGRRYDELHCRQVSGKSPAKTRLLVSRLFTGIATGPLACADVAIQRHELGPETFHVVASGRANVEPVDNGAEPPCGGDRLQASYARPERNHSGGFDRTGCRSQHWEQDAERACPLQYRSIPSD